MEKMKENGHMEGKKMGQRESKVVDSLPWKLRFHETNQREGSDTR